MPPEAHSHAAKPMTNMEMATSVENTATQALHGDSDALSMLQYYVQGLFRQGALDPVARQMQWDNVIPGLGEVIGNRVGGVLKSLDFVGTPSNNIHCSEAKDWACERQPLQK